MSLLSSSLIRFTFAGGALAVLWAGSNQVNRNLAELPVHQVQQVTDPTAVGEAKALYPVWVGKAVQPRPAIEGDPNVEAAFQQGAAVQQAVAAPVEPEYADQLRTKLRVDGVTSGGAFINGRFYAIGAGLADLQVQRVTGEAMIPRLTAATTARIVIAVGNDTLTLELGPAGWQ